MLLTLRLQRWYARSSLPVALVSLSFGVRGKTWWGYGGRTKCCKFHIRREMLSMYYPCCISLSWTCARLPSDPAGHFHSCHPPPSEMFEM